MLLFILLPGVGSLDVKVATQTSCHIVQIMLFNTKELWREECGEECGIIWRDHDNYFNIDVQLCALYKMLYTMGQCNKEWVGTKMGKAMSPSEANLNYYYMFQL